MGIFDFFKRKNKTNTSSSETYIQKKTVTQTKEENTYNFGNGIGMSTGIQVSYTEYAYNEVLAYARFLNKYKTIKAPKYLHESEYAHWQFMSAGVEEVHKLHQELFDKGFYRPATVDEMLSTYTIPEIKRVASELAISVSGKKNDMIRTIAQNATAEMVAGILKTEIYTISDKALIYLEEHSLDIEYYNRDCNDMSLEEYKATRQTVSERDIEWRDLQSALQAEPDQFGRNTHYHIAGYHKKYGDNKDALLSYLRVLYIDLSGAECYRAWDMMRGTDKESVQFRLNCTPSIVIAPGLIKEIQALVAEFFALDMIEQLYSEELPIQVCSKTMFTEIVSLIQKDALNQNILQTIEDTLNKNLKILAKKF